MPNLEPPAFHQLLQSPIGTLSITANDQGLTEIRFAHQSIADRPKRPQVNAVIDRAVSQLQSYFAGNLKVFDVPLSPPGTGFQKKVWLALQQVEYGKTTSYGQIAANIGKPTAARAVGAANGKNPLPIIVPCHRVIGRDGSLTGFTGGLDIKRWLLDHERNQAN